MKESLITVGQDILQLIAEIDEFKGQWQALKTFSPERLQQLRKVATIESVLPKTISGSYTRLYFVIVPRMSGIAVCLLLRVFLQKRSTKGFVACRGSTK